MATYAQNYTIHIPKTNTFYQTFLLHFRGRILAMQNKHLEALRLAMRAHLAEKYKNIFDEKEILSRQLISDRLIAQMTLEQGAVL